MGVFLWHGCRLGTFWWLICMCGAADTITTSCVHYDSRRGSSHLSPSQIPQLLKLQPARILLCGCSRAQNETVAQCWANVGPTFTTSTQHQPSIGLMSHIYWEVVFLCRWRSGDEGGCLQGFWSILSACRLIRLHSKRETLSPCWLNSGPASQTVDRQ